ncbi:MAG: hypothetical protein IJT30_08635 [Muribaculaceae bacterium]|nr:hypothetical protein [Muribaculaceae bacterium]
MQSLHDLLWGDPVGRDLKGMELKAVNDAQVQVPQLVARRFNIGNMGREAVVRLELRDALNRFTFKSIVALATFAHVLTDVAATDSGDRTITFDWDEDYWDFGTESQSVCKSIACGDEPGNSPIIFDEKQCEFNMLPESEAPQIKNNIVKSSRESDDFVWENWDDVCEGFEDRDSLTEQEEREVQSIEADRQRAFDELRRAVLHYVITCHQDPTHLIEEIIQGKFIFGRDNLSPLTVNGDLEIVLPGYDEARVKMPALCRAIYILFLCHRRDGIVLKEFANYRAELEGIYALVMPGRDERRATATIDNLCDPMANTLKEYISKIKKCFSGLLVDKCLLDRYVITGTRGEPYRIDLPDDLVNLPAAITA